MEVKIKTINLELSDSIYEYIESKILTLEKFIKNVDPAAVIADIEVGKPSGHHRKGQVFYAEVNITLPGKLLRAVSENYDLKLAIDQVKDELQRQLKKYKEKIIDITHKRKDFEVSAQSWTRPRQRKNRGAF